MQELFHGLIRSRAREGRLPIPRRLPKLAELRIEAEEPVWFPVAGMYGGFAYRLVLNRGEIVLQVESWSRVSDGSGMRHRISPKEVVLEEEGFV